jgi:hypothetical protein
MLFAVFETSVESQEHDANQPTPTGIIEKGTWSTLHAICDRAPLIRLAFSRQHPPENRRSSAPIGKVGLAVLQLFGGMLIFNGSCRQHVRQLARDVRAGRYEPKIEKQAADLYMNPRRVR